MSIADSADYQLQQLAGALTEADANIRATKNSAEYIQGYTDALKAIAEDMNLTATVRTEYSY